ncbi:MAG: hypothetical protein ACRDWE_08640, partial [Acidimicrobiales bacterium]
MVGGEVVVVVVVVGGDVVVVVAAVVVVVPGRTADDGVCDVSRRVACRCPRAGASPGTLPPAAEVGHQFTTVRRTAATRTHDATTPAIRQVVRRLEDRPRGRPSAAPPTGVSLSRRRSSHPVMGAGGDPSAPRVG